MINLSAISVSAASGHSSKIQGQTPGGAGDGASGLDFPPLAGFGHGGGEGSTGLSPLSGQGFGGGAPSGGDGLLSGEDSAPVLAEGQLPQSFAGGAARAADAIDATVVQPVTGAAGYADATQTGGDSGHGFAGSGMSAGYHTPTAGAEDSRPQARVHSQSPALLSQGASHTTPRELSHAASHNHTQLAPQTSAQTGAHELGRTLAPLLGNAGLQTAPLRANADAATLLPSAQGSQLDSSLLAAGATRSGTAAIPEWSPVKVDAQQAHWGRDLMAALAERVEMQISQQIKQARIRLDPPELGRLQLTVRLDGDRLSVQFNASHPQVREALHHQQDRLRADLAGEYGQGVEVSVGHEQGRQRSPAGDQPWDAFEMGIETGLLVVDGELDGPEAGGEGAAPSAGDKSWVSALV